MYKDSIRSAAKEITRCCSMESTLQVIRLVDGALLPNWILHWLCIMHRENACKYVWCFIPPNISWNQADINF